MPSVVAIGFFDGVHLGHRHLIAQVQEEARRRGWPSRLITFDRHPRTVFAPDFVPPLLTTREEKTRLLLSTGVDDIHFLPFNRDLAAMSAHDFMQSILLTQMDAGALVIGYDHHFGRRASGSGAKEEGFDDYVRYGNELGIDVVAATELDYPLHVSSSAIRRSILAGDVSNASLLLGRPYSWSGRVVHGHAIGRQLGFPTANLESADPSKLIPARGVYAVRVDGISPSPLPAMVNIGTRPTIDAGEMSIEVNILDFSGDIYGQTLTLHFISRLRTETQFPNPEALAHQLELDAAQTRAILAKASS
ncbi:MAG: riboflavin biosynthesis protein RibF [Bacteroidaceae bacterium]|nr:riboflavin biosynthesis protein RibF [Bacteroidaceae bacterium]